VFSIRNCCGLGRFPGSWHIQPFGRAYLAVTQCPVEAGFSASPCHARRARLPSAPVRAKAPAPYSQAHRAANTIQAAARTVCQATVAHILLCSFFKQMCTYWHCPRICCRLQTGAQISCVTIDKVFLCFLSSIIQKTEPVPSAFAVTLALFF